ncbi:hypothetical protein KW507_07750, partial [Vibrio fluvialis]|nr:hypothetical protein [Vibrio fluvialis]MBY7939423.1 hypothetical protein [Vibrio fluvialis]MBY8166561.1 hypothetical protein [Vibrio fluvialis]
RVIKEKAVKRLTVTQACHFIGITRQAFYKRCALELQRTRKEQRMRHPLSHTNKTVTGRAMLLSELNTGTFVFLLRGFALFRKHCSIYPIIWNRYSNLSMKVKPTLTPSSAILLTLKSVQFNHR